MVNIDIDSKKNNWNRQHTVKWHTMSSTNEKNIEKNLRSLHYWGIWYTTVYFWLIVANGMINWKNPVLPISPD